MEVPTRADLEQDRSVERTPAAAGRSMLVVCVGPSISHSRSREPSTPTHIIGDAAAVAVILSKLRQGGLVDG
jgi:hypothetical protein